MKEAESRLDVSFSFHWMGKEKASLDYIKRALACLERAPGELRLRAKAHVQWGLAATNSGEMLKAQEELQLADELHAQLEKQDPFIGVVSLWARSWCAFACGTQQEMLDYARRNAELCRAIHMFAWEPMMTYSAAWALMLMGRLAEAVQVAQETREEKKEGKYLKFPRYCPLSVPTGIEAGTDFSKNEKIAPLDYFSDIDPKPKIVRIIHISRPKDGGDEDIQEDKEFTSQESVAR